MRLLTKAAFRWMVPFVAIFLAGNTVHAGDGGGGGSVIARAVLDGSLNQIRVDSSRTVLDSAFFNPSYSADLDTSYAVQNLVTLMINESSRVYLKKDFTVTVTLRISYTNGAQDSSIVRDFTINYDSAGTYNSRSSLVFNGAHQVTIKVLAVNSSDSTWNPVKALLIENQLVTRPNFKLSCSNTVTNITVTPSVTDTAADELPVSWTAVLGAGQYDLEWTYIDTSALAAHRYGNPLDPALVFLNNATRVTTAATSYNIPLIYDDSGTLFIRVRPIQVADNNAVTAAAWSSDASPSVMGQYHYTGHQRPLNWQSNISFAEEGKRKVVVQYYDGSLRSRQTVTKDNTTNTTIVAETYYDYQGRPALQVMPSPTLRNSIQYMAGFNTGINGAEYNQSNYDSLSDPSLFCSIHADSMSNSAGASQYYSPRNPNKTVGMNQFIPDAQDYPFAETEYTPDNTGRISRQGGVGKDHQLGGGHETKYFYGTPDQNELDALFGTEAGDHTHYFKNMVCDANGQYSVSYVDMHGRTIATALAGLPPSGLATLPTYISDSLYENLADSNSLFLQDLSMISQKSLQVPTGGNYAFHYDLRPPVYSEKNCNNTNICYTCRYDLEISISDNCNNQLIGRGGKPFDTVFHNFSPGAIPLDCSPADTGVNFTLNLPEGSYLVSKKLTVNKDAYVYYRDSVYLPNNTCVSLSQFIDQQKTVIASSNSQCVPDCHSCFDSLGTWDHYWSNFIAKTGIPLSDTASYRAQVMTDYQNAGSACALLCGDSLLSAETDIRNQMIQDMSPPFGQYADTSRGVNTDKYSIFYAPAKDTSYVPVFQLPAVQYNNDIGVPDSVFDVQSQLMVIPNELSTDQFVQNFRSSWAEALLPYHPEYCKLLALESFHSSNVWDRQFENVDTYADAVARGYLNPTGNATYTQYAIVSSYTDPLAANSTAKAKLEAKLTKYLSAAGGNPDISMWAMANITAKCPSGDKDCIVFYAGTPSNNFNTGSMCTGDLDMAWRNFRQLYLQAKQDILNAIVSNPVGCTPLNSRVYTKPPAAKDLFSKGHQPEFNDSKDRADQTLPGDFTKANGNQGAANNALAIANESITSYYDQNSRALAQQWISQLSKCQYPQPGALADSILPRLTGLCRKACDADHPFGASSLPTGVVYTDTATGQTFTSFQDIIDRYNSNNHITDTLACNAELITAPQPYYNQPVYAAKPVYSRPADCECTLINNLHTDYTLSDGRDANFSAYLKRTQQINMSESDLDQLITMCGGLAGTASCINLSEPIYLPPVMQCYAGPACSTCSEIDTLYNAFLQHYPGDTPVVGQVLDTTQLKKNALFQNYMNNRLGYNKQTWEYLAFMDSCTVHRDSANSVVECFDKAVAHIFQVSNGVDTMMDVRVTPDSGYIMVGDVQVFSKIGAANGLNAYIIKMDHSGHIQWAKTYGGMGDDKFNRVKPTADHGYIAIGTSASTSHQASDMMIVKFNASGDTVWTRMIGYNTVHGETGVDIVQLDNGGYAAVGGYNNTPGDGDFMICGLDSLGSLRWMRQRGGESSDIPSAVFATGDTVFSTGGSYNTGRYYGVIYRNLYSSGDTLRRWYYWDSAGSDMSFYLNRMYPTDSGYRVYGYTAQGYSSTGGSVTYTDISRSGAVQRYSVLQIPPHSSFVTSSAFYKTRDGGYIMGEMGDTPEDISWLKLNALDSIEWTRQTRLPGTTAMYQVVQGADGGFSGVGQQGSEGFMLNLTNQGRTGCYDTSVSISRTRLTLSGTDQTTVDTVHVGGRNDISLSLNSLIPTDDSISCTNDSGCHTIYNGPLLCGKSDPLFPQAMLDSITACSDSTFFAVSKGTEFNKTYRDSLTGDFEQQYLKTCMQAYRGEQFTVRHLSSEYHYTLYYYDQAGNLLKTVAPAGVRKNTDTAWLSLVRAARASGQTLAPPHVMETEYRYNTLNQVIAQHSPDGGLSHFWYDRLGRLSVSQNARQVSGNQYSYTKYDTIGRIVEVGQLVSSTAITDSVSRRPASLALWLNNAASSADQITQTVYDTAYSPLLPELGARNLRNRVAYTSLYNTASDLSAGSPASAIYYSYDILGNVDTLVQDYKKGVMAANSNRFKKLVYQYDLVSGKVNQVSYQHGAADAFYHSYLYDAENRITNVMSSRDSVNWDNDAFYSYYAHGPLARTIIGEQQVQGVNYAYSLQGWLKSINPGVNTGSGNTLTPDGSTGSVVASNAYALRLNYFNGDYSPIGGGSSLDTGSNTALAGEFRPLYNGNISSMGVDVGALGHSLLYNYQYDQLNRLVGMDAWNRTSTAWNMLTKLSDFQERISYDPNGNILGYKRNGNNTFSGQPLGMDSLHYAYIAGTNRLDHITDSVPLSNYDEDIDGQSAGNFKYDSIGNLISDDASHITNITWTVYGKIASISKAGDTTILYTYDPAGNRISKAVAAHGDTTTTWYARDAQGNVLSVYTAGNLLVNSGDLSLTEQHLYGSSRLGMLKCSTNVVHVPVDSVITMPELGSGYPLIFTRGNKLFELTNHLGNVLATISDKKWGHSTDDSTVAFFNPEVVYANDYYPFGMLEPKRDFSKTGVGGYRYGFNGKENDNEVKGEGNQQDYGMRIYDPRLGKFLSVDPIAKKYPQLTPYQFASNRSIDGIDLDGLEFFKRDDRHYLLDYQPVFKAPTFLTGLGNVFINAGNATSNLTIGSLLEGSKAINNYIAGGYKEPAGLDPISGIINYTNEQGEYMSHTPFTQQLSDFGEGLTDLHNYEHAFQLFTLAAPIAELNLSRSFTLKAEVTQSVGLEENFSEKFTLKKIYIPKDHSLEQQNVAGWDIPLPDVNAGDFGHTTLGGKIGSDGVLYRQSATFTGGTWPLANGKIVPWSRVDWSNHGRPWDHFNPHQHVFFWNRARWEYGSGEHFESSTFSLK